MTPGGDQPIQRSRACGCGDGDTEGDPAAPPNAEFRRWPHRRVVRMLAVAPATPVAFLVWSCCVNWKRDRMLFYKIAAVAAGAAVLHPLVIQLATPSSMPRSLSWRNDRLKNRRPPPRSHISAMHEGGRPAHFSAPTVASQNTCNRQRRDGARPTSCGRRSTWWQG